MNRIVRVIERGLQWLQEATTRPFVRIPTITLLTWFISHTIIYDITSASIFAPIEKSNDFEMSDIYNVVSIARPVRTLDPDIVVIGVDQCSRAEIGSLIQLINLSEPRAIGLDVIFGFFTEQDAPLIETFNQSNNLVFAYDANEVIGTVFAPQLTEAHWGAINFFTKKHSGIVRHFRPHFGDTLNAFAVELARIGAPDAYSRLKSRGNEFETICYPSQEFTLLEGADILKGTIDPFDLDEILSGKIILLGDLHNPIDQHQTPINADMPGIIINAHALSTILQDNYIETTSERTNWTLAILISLLFASVIVGCQSSTRIKAYTTFILRTTQILLMVSFIYIGCYAFAKWHFYCNFAPCLLMIGLGILASAIEPVVGLIIRTALRILENIRPISQKTIYILDNYREKMLKNKESKQDKI